MANLKVSRQRLQKSFYHTLKTQPQAAHSYRCSAESLYFFTVISRNMPTAFIIGIARQDGSSLAGLLLSKGYHVAGVACVSDMLALERIEAILPQITLVAGDLAKKAGGPGHWLRANPCGARLVSDCLQSFRPKLSERCGVDSHFDRPVEPRQLVSDPRLARSLLGWQPKINFEQRVIMMADAEMDGIKSTL